MKVIHLSVECYPIAKVGGLADVIGALPKYQRKLGVDAQVVMPWYDKPSLQQFDLEKVAEGVFLQGSQSLTYSVYTIAEHHLGFPIYLIKVPGLLDRNEVYGYADEGEQWIAFQHAFLHWILTDNIRPDVINCHDHHVGLIPFLLQYGNDFRELSYIKTLFTIHNGQYQGWMNWNKGILLPGFDTWKWGLLDWSGVINPFSSAIRCCDAFSTVSEGYLEELSQECKGLEQLFIDESSRGFGIVNGIDSDVWDPSSDPLIPYHYSNTTVKTGKRKNKEAFCKKANLPSDSLLLTYIGRFAEEKGADILSEVIRNFYSKNEKKLIIFILGSGNEQIQQDLELLCQSYPNKVSAFFGYNETLAHEAYAASDLILMPSRVEPCGLNQLYALKYGTIPVVRGIGGLKDTVIDISEPKGYGFVFKEFEVDKIVETIERAVEFSLDEKKWVSIVKQSMALDYSWDKSAKKYIELYNQLLK